MNNTTATGEQCTSASPSMNILDRWAKKTLFKMLAGIRFGQLTITDGCSVNSFGPDKGLQARVTIHDPRVYRQVLFGGSIGAADGYIDRFWDCDDLTALTRIMVLNMEMLDDMDRGFSRLFQTFRRIGHLLRANSPKRARRNILAHYDLGNEMYSTFLDSTMMYSSAIYPQPVSSLEEASRYKLEQICQKLALKPGDRIIEIGTGWGAFAIHAAANYGCHVTTTTISDAQYEEAARRIAAASLTDRITLLKQDYRQLSGRFDKLVSIEMIEAVGHEFLPDFFQKCGELLHENGTMLLQAITIRDQKYEQYIRSVDFIQTHIFPGGHVPSLTRMIDCLTRRTDMVVRHVEDFGHHYARTLGDWRRRFLRAYPELREKGYDERFRRLWEYYLCYCQGGFMERSISVVHLVATRPEHRVRLL